MKCYMKYLCVRYLKAVFKYKLLNNINLQEYENCLNDEKKNLKFSSKINFGNSKLRKFQFTLTSSL